MNPLVALTALIIYCILLSEVLKLKTTVAHLRSVVDDMARLGRLQGDRLTRLENDHAHHP